MVKNLRKLNEPEELAALILSEFPGEESFVNAALLAVETSLCPPDIQEIALQGLKQMCRAAVTQIAERN